jgi:lysophospholipase L1-like esterase
LYLCPHLFLPFATMRIKYAIPLFVFLIAALFSKKSLAQPFIEDIQNFKNQDRISFPPKNAILFIGSSSFTNWKDVQNYFPKHTILNRGFGGSSLTDVIRYANDIIFPYQPKQIVIYCGENDIAGDSTVTGKVVFKRFQKLYFYIRKIGLYAPVIYISMKPSPSRWDMKERMLEGNRLIQKFLKKKQGAPGFVSVWNEMLGPDGKPMEDIFIEDKLHMNAKGYAIWQKIIEPYLIK